MTFYPQVPRVYVAMVLSIVLAGEAPASAAPLPTLTAILTKKKVSTVDEAEANRVSSVKDGQPLFLVLAVGSGTLADISFSISDDPAVTGHDLPWLRFVHGKAGSPNTSYKQCTFALTKEEGTRSSIALSLAPGDLRPAGSLNCFLKVASGDKGVWKNELRFTDDTYKSLAPVPLEINVADGVAAYKSLWKQFEPRIEAGSTEFNEPPSPVDIKDARLTSSARARASQALGAPLKRFFFTDDAWYEDTNKLGIVVSTHTTAAMTYKRGAKCFYEVLSVTRSTSGGVKRVERTAPASEITCNKL